MDGEKSHERRKSRTNCVSIADDGHEMRDRPSGRPRFDELLDLTEVRTRNWYGAAHRRGKLGDAVFARSSQARDSVDRDDVAAMDAHEAPPIESRLARADGEGAEI